MSEKQSPTSQTSSDSSANLGANQGNGKKTRKRAQGVSKVKTGCATCKIRRLKCDETKPSCLKCTSTGRRCDGYPTQLIIVNGSVRSPNNLNCSAASNSLAITSPTFAFQGTHQERRAFELFRTRIAFQISGNLDGWFWNTLLLQATHHEAAVRHAVLALSALCEHHETGDLSSSEMTQCASRQAPLALQQYNAAIVALTNAASHHELTVDVCLMTCMLFASFEVIGGHHGSAMAHITSGVRIIEEIQSDPKGSKPSAHFKIPTDPYVDLDSFQVIFNRLNAQAAQIKGCPPMQIRLDNPSVHAKGFCPDLPIAFRSIEEARNSLEYHSTQCMHLFASLGWHPTAEQLAIPRAYVNVFTTWQGALQAFLDNAGDSLSTTGKQTARVLQLNRMFHVSNALAATSGEPLNDMYWDLQLEYFRQILLLAREVVEQSEDDLARDSRNSHRFDVGLNIVAPLCSTALTCRDPALRREAVSLLERSHNQQGLWDANITVRVCKRVIEMEEKGLGQVTHCNAIPESARVSGVRVISDADGRVGAIAYRRKPEGYKSKAQAYKDLIAILEDDIDTGVGYTEGDVNVKSLDADQIKEYAG